MFDSQIIAAVKEIHQKLEGRCIFCGSFALKFHGLLDRLVKDLDVITEDTFYGTQASQDILRSDSSGTFQLNGVFVNCNHGSANGIKVDYFYRHDQTKFNVVEFYGIDIKVEIPLHAIEAKEQYLASPTTQNKEKHRQDLDFIKSRLLTNGGHRFIETK